MCVRHFLRRLELELGEMHEAEIMALSGLPSRLPHLIIDQATLHAFDDSIQSTMLRSLHNAIPKYSQLD